MSFIPIVCPPGSGSGDSGPDIEQELLCDVLNGEVVGTALVVIEYDSDGNPVLPPTFIDPVTGNPYIPQGVMQPCPEGSTAEFVLCDIQPDGSSVQFIRKLIQGPTGAVLEVQDETLDGAIYSPSVSGTIALCDPYTTCTPTADQDLAGDCGAGESPTQSIISNDTTHPLSNAVYVDDPAADALCGGSWDNPAAALPPGFPVDESFRNTTFDQPGPVTQGTAPYPQLTAGAPINDGAGAGWLRVSDINSGTNGVWQVPTPFPTSQGMTASITLASHDGTTPGGDGAAFVFTDGSAPQQATTIGGFGNLGLNNWDGGYVAVVLDEYGQSCTCDHTAHGTVSPNPGPCGFCTNTISIQLAGTARATASCSCCTIVSQSLNPKAINLTTRAQPLRLTTSIISEGGQTYVSASIDWNDGNGPIVYFDRVNVTACAGPPPATLRMASFGGSGGSFRAIKEWRDASARPAGETHWRAFPITTDPIPACVTLLNISGSVDVTFNSDTQTTGNGDPEAYFWLVNEASGTVLKRSEKSSIPAQVGTPTTLKWTASVAPADLPNLMVYVGSESRDQNGEYDTLWENLNIDVSGTGCPAAQRRTLEISARCPIPVVLAGGGDSGGGGTTIVNTPATFEDAPICMEINGVNQSGFRREVRAADGSITVTFLGADGLPQNPTTWFPGSCVTRDPEITILCDDNGQFLRVFTFDENGNIIGTDDFDLLGGPYVPVGTIRDCGLGVAVDTRCYFDNTGQQFTRAYVFTDDSGIPVSFGDFLADGTPYAPTLPLFACDARILQDTEEEILCDNNGPFLRRYSWGTSTNANPPVVTDWQLDGLAPYVTVGPVILCPETVAVTTEFDVEEEVLCDDNGAFVRRFTFNVNTGALVSTADFTLGGGAYVPVGTVRACSQSSGSFDIEYQCFIDGNGTRFFRAYVFTDGSGVPTAIGNFDTAGAAFAPVGIVTPCENIIRQDAELQVLCDSNGTRFLRKYSYSIDNGNLVATFVVNTTLDGVTPFVPVGAVGVCTATVTTDRDFLEEVLCDDNGGFIRRFVFDSATGNLISSTDLTLAGAAYVPVGTVHTCDQCCPIDVANVCLANGHPGVIIRNSNGTLSYIDTVTNTAFNPATDIVTCPEPVATVTVQGRLLAATQSWTPGADVIGTLTGLGMAILTGTATLTDQNGTVSAGLPAGLSMSWNAEDQDTLSPPQSITAAAASTVMVWWTQR